MRHTAVLLCPNERFSIRCGVVLLLFPNFPSFLVQFLQQEGGSRLTFSCVPCSRYIRGIVHYEFVPTGQTVNQVYYLEVLERLREKVSRKRPEHFANSSCILHHDNAPAHTALSVRKFLATKQITVLEHPAYLPDLAPSEFFLFPKVKEILKGRHFDDIADIRSDTPAALKDIPQNQSQNCFEGRWHRCIASQRG